MGNSVKVNTVMDLLKKKKNNVFHTLNEREGKPISHLPKNPSRNPLTGLQKRPECYSNSRPLREASGQGNCVSPSTGRP